MNSPASIEPAPAVDSADLNVVLLYDDMKAGHRAMNAAVKLATGLHRVAEFRHSIWRFDHLDDPGSRAAASAAAAEADFVIVATSHADALPAGINRWMEECLKIKHGRPAVMLALFGNDDPWTISIRDGTTRLSAHRPEKSPAESPPVPLELPFPS